MYGDPVYFGVHQLTVDTYAAQHPGRPEPRSIQSLALHLITLCLVVEPGAAPGDGPALHQRLAKRPGFHWLELPRPVGRVTVADVHGAASAAEHERRVRAWARDVWEVWEPHHATIRHWIEHSLAEG